MKMERGNGHCALANIGLGKQVHFFFFVGFIQEFCLIPAENNHWVWFCYTLSTIFILTPHPSWLFTQHLLFYSSTVALIASFVIGH